MSKLGGRQRGFLEDGKVRRFSLVLANFPFSDEFWWLKPEQQTDDKKKKDKRH